MIPIANAQHGKLVKLVGRIAYASPPLEAPLSGRPCAYYRVKVEEGEGERKTRIEEVACCPELWVENASGRALVEMKAPRVRLVMDAHSRSGSLRKPTRRQHDFLDKHKEQAAGLNFNRPLTYLEGVLEAGEEIAVFGLCKIEVDPDPPADANRLYRQTPMRARVVAPAGKRVLLSDHPRVVATARAQGKE